MTVGSLPEVYFYKHFNNECPTETSEYKKVLKDFISHYQNRDVDAKRDLTKVLVKNMESLFNLKTNDRTFEVQYIADKSVEAD